MNRNNRKAGGAADFARRYLDRLAGLLQSIDTEEVGKVAGVLEEARRRGRKIFLIGNGGSAATASHMANDLGIGCKEHTGRRFQTISLTDNVPVMTAIANDYGYDEVFVGQLEYLLSPRDVVIAISASGNSSNVVRAVRYAARKNAVTVGFVGFDGGALRRLCDHVVWVKTPKGEYGPVEDIHMILDHLLMSYLKSSSRHA